MLKSFLKNIVIILLLLSVVLSPLYSEQYYSISETELITLENNLETYKTIAEDLKKQTEQLKLSYEKSEKERLMTNIKVGTVCICVGSVIGVGMVHTIRRIQK